MRKRIVSFELLPSNTDCIQFSFHSCFSWSMEQGAVMTDFVMPCPVEIVRHHIDHVDISKKIDADRHDWFRFVTGREQGHRNPEWLGICPPRRPDWSIVDRDPISSPLSWRFSSSSKNDRWSSADEKERLLSSVDRIVLDDQPKGIPSRDQHRRIHVVDRMWWHCYWRFL